MELRRGRAPRQLAVAVYDLLLGSRFLVPGMAWPKSSDVPKRPFFIIGSGRSGTTLLRRMLCQHPQLHIPPETYVLNDVIRAFGRYSKMHWPDLVQLLLAKFEYHPEFISFNCSLRSVAHELAALPFGQRSLGALIDGVYSYHAEVVGKPGARWGDKTPLNTFHLDKIRRVFPDAQFIHMLRDGVDVVHSYVRSGLYGRYHEAAKRWVDAVTAAEAFRNKYPSQCLCIRYENLVGNCVREAERIKEFLGFQGDVSQLITVDNLEALGDVPLRSHHGRVFEPTDQSSVGKGRRELSDAVRSDISPLLSRDLCRLGYDPI